ncbi:MAG: hypothetical protein WDM78_24340 [Puia sp.]
MKLAGVGCLVDSCRICENCKEGLEQYCLNGSSPTYNGIEQDKKNTHLWWLLENDRGRSGFCT